MKLTDIAKMTYSARWALQFTFGNHYEATELHRGLTPQEVATRLRSLADRIERLDPPTLLEGWARPTGTDLWHHFITRENLSACGRHDRENLQLFSLSDDAIDGMRRCDRCETATKE